MSTCATLDLARTSTAMSWNETLQSGLPEYASLNGTRRLFGSDETGPAFGGLKLAMPPHETFFDGQPVKRCPFQKQCSPLKTYVSLPPVKQRHSGTQPRQRGFFECSLGFTPLVMLEAEMPPAWRLFRTVRLSVDSSPCTCMLLGIFFHAPSLPSVRQRSRNSVGERVRKDIHTRQLHR